MNACLKMVKLGDIRPNPFRDIEHYPIDRVKVELLRQSFERTGFWEGYLIVRPAGDAYEMPFGHHRTAAAKELWGADHEIPVVVKELSDDLMLAMMAHENNERFAQFFYLAVMEPIEAVVKAYAEGRIELERPDPKTPKSGIRNAPSFLQDESLGHPYAALSVSRYLGWVEQSKTRDTQQAASRVLTALAGLELIERKVLTRQQFLSLTTTQAEALVNVTRATIKAREQDAEAEARVHAEAASRAKQAGNARKAEEHTAVAERARENAEETAAKAAKALGAQVAERFAAGERVKDVLQDTVAASVETSRRAAKGVGARVTTAPYSADEVEAVARRWDKLATEDERARLAACRSTKAKAELVASAKRLRERLSLLMKEVG